VTSQAASPPGRGSSVAVTLPPATY